MRETKTKIDKAEKRAVRKTANFAKTLISRQLSKSAGTPLFSVKHRVDLNKSEDESSYTLWVGTVPLPARYLVKDRNSLVRFIDNRPKRGVKLGKHFWNNSFVAPIGRKKDSDEDSEGSTRFGGAKSFDVFIRQGTERLPIKRRHVEIETPVDSFIEGSKQEISNRFEKTLAQELNFALNVEK